MKSQNTQSYNRYAYCLNNPMKYTDPSGYMTYNVNGMRWQGSWWSLRAFLKGNGDIIDEIDVNGFEFFDSKNPNSPIKYSANRNDFGFWKDNVDVNRLTISHDDKGNMVGSVPMTVSSKWISVLSDDFWNSFGTGGNGKEGNGLSFEQAQFLYKFGGGNPINVDIKSIDLSKVRMSDFNSRGLATIRLDGKHFSNFNDALVHGTITLQLIGNTNYAKVALNSDPNTPQINGKPAGMYDFEMQSLGKVINWIRNPLTFIGGIVNGTMFFGGTPIYVGGTSYPIFYNGQVKINQ